MPISRATQQRRWTVSKKAHKNRTKDFAELTFSEQAKSITATINNLSNAIRHHVQNAPNKKKRCDTKKKCINQVYRFLGRLLKQ
jgi:hypothetical protein